MRQEWPKRYLTILSIRIQKDCLLAAAKGRSPIPLPVLNDFLGDGEVPKTEELTKPPSKDTALEIRGLSIGYETRSGFNTQTLWVVKDLDLTLQVGETLGLIGHQEAVKAALAERW